MDLEDALYQIAARIPKQLEHLKTEEATKAALVMPFINALGYNVFDPTEVIPEFIADVGLTFQLDVIPTPGSQSAVAPTGAAADSLPPTAFSRDVYDAINPAANPAPSLSAKMPICAAKNGIRCRPTRPICSGTLPLPPRWSAGTSTTSLNLASLMSLCRITD